MGLDPSILHAEHIARRLSPADRRKVKVQTAAEAAEKGAARTEKAIQDAIAQTLRRRGIDFIRPSMSERSRLPVGWADLSVFLPGPRTVFIEVKYGDAKLEPDQELFRARVLAMGFEHHVCRSYDEAMAVLTDQGARC